MGWFAPETPLAALVETHYAPLYRFAWRLSGCATEAEDLTQETFIKAHVNSHQLREPERARGWLFRILRNEYLQKARGPNGKKATTLDEETLSITEDRDDWPGDLDSEALQKALDELPEDFRTPLILYFFEDFSYRDIAEQMDLPIGTVMSRLARAKRQLRERLEPLAAREST